MDVQRHILLQLEFIVLLLSNTCIERLYVLAEFFYALKNKKKRAQKIRLSFLSSTFLQILFVVLDSFSLNKHLYRVIIFPVLGS